jgi:hypothetical protein
MGSYEQSLADFEKALSLSPDDFNSNLSINFSIAGVYLDSKEYDKAIELCTKIIWQAPDYTLAYSNRAWAYSCKGDYEHALADYNRVSKMEPDYADTYSFRGITYEKSGEYEKAVADYKKAFEVAGKGNRITDILAVNWYLLNPFYISHPFLNVSDEDGTFFHSHAQVMASGISAGIEKVEQLRSYESSQGSSLMEQVLFLYYAGVDLEVNVGAKEKAFEYSEALRGRGFLEEMGTAAALRLPGVTEAERQNVERLTQEITNTRNILGASDSQQTQSAADITRSADANRRLNALEKELAELDASIADRIPQYRFLRNPSPVSMEKAREWCDKDTAVLEYVLWDDTVDFNPVTKGTTWEGMTERPGINSYCLILTKDGVTPVLLDYDFDYTGKIKDFRRLVAESNTVEVLRNDLYEKLIKPVIPHLPANIKNIIIVPDGQLAYLPFDILRENSESPDFGETYALSLSPSVSVSILAKKEIFKKRGRYWLLRMRFIIRKASERTGDSGLLMVQPGRTCPVQRRKSHPCRT